MVRAVWVQVARGCARIDSRPDTAKIGSAGRLEVHHARLLAVIGVRKTFPHGLGQNRKSALVTVTPQQRTSSGRPQAHLPLETFRGVHRRASVWRTKQYRAPFTAIALPNSGPIV